MRSSDWCPVESVLRSEVWFSIVPFDVAESFFSQAWGQALADALSTPQAKTTVFSSSGIIHPLESAAFTVLFVSGRSRSSMSSLLMIGSPRRGLCGVGIVPLRLNGPYQ